MSKEEIEVASIIPDNEFISELEVEVQYYLSKIPPQVKNTIKYSRTSHPEKINPNSIEDKIFVIEEIRRCVEGFNGMSGKLYFFYNYCFLKDPELGKIRPDYRKIAADWFQFITDHQAMHDKRGIVSIKRRRVGASFMAAADVLHDCIFTPFFSVGMTSRSEASARDLFKHVKMMYQSLPEWMRPRATSSDRRDHMEFAYYVKDSSGNRIKKGLQSSILSVAPTDTGMEGYQFGKAVFDESGKCLGINELVLMSDGSTKAIKDIKIGDFVMGVDSKPNKVVARVRGEDEMYEVTGRRDVKFTCNSKHILATYHSATGYQEITPTEYLALPPVKQRYYQLKFTGVEYSKNDYFFDPYWFGLWLGDGNSDTAQIVAYRKLDEEVYQYLTEEAPSLHGVEHSVYKGNQTTEGLSLVNLLSGKHRYKVTELDGKVELFKNSTQLCDYYNISFKAYQQFVGDKAEATFKPHHKRGVSNLKKYIDTIEECIASPRAELEALGVLHNKHIPECYLKTSREDRLQLLAGLIDSDGYKKPDKNAFEIASSFPQLADGIFKLAKSLGFSVKKTTKVASYTHKGEKKYTTSERILIYGNDLHEIPTRVPRKQAKPSVKTKGRRDTQKTGFTIKPIGKGEYCGITLEDSPLFLGHDYLIHHNCPNLLTMWANAQDCLMKPPRMVGLPLVFGTVGSLSENGDGVGLRDMWINNEVYKFDRFFFRGCNALDGMIDDLGNDDYVNGCRWIVYERHKKKSSKREYESHKQKYPLDENDAFHSIGSGGVGNKIFIQSQITKLQYNPPIARTGWMRPKPDGGVDFVPNESGKIIIYELPDPRRVDGYLSGIDPADHDDLKKSKDVSDLAVAIGAKPFGMEPPKLVAEYVDRPEKLDSFFIQSAMLLQYYGNAKALIEDNRARMVNYFKQHYPHLLPLVPKSIATSRPGFEMRNSIKMTEERKQQGMGLMEDYIDQYCEFIPSIKLLEQHKVFGDPHASDDLSMAWLLMLILLQSSKKAVRTTDQLKPPTNVHYERRDGRLVLVSDNKIISPNRIIPRSPLFK